MTARRLIRCIYNITYFPINASLIFKIISHRYHLNYVIFLTDNSDTCELARVAVIIFIFTARIFAQSYLSRKFAPAWHATARLPSQDEE